MAGQPISGLPGELRLRFGGDALDTGTADPITSAASSDERSALALLAARGEVAPLSALSIRSLDDQVKERLRVRAARHGRSMEAEVRAILTEAVAEPDETPSLFQAIMDRFGELGGVELDLPPRAARTRAAELSS
jgi:antitoxin FitA